MTFYNSEAADAFEMFKPEQKFRHVSEDTGVNIIIQKLYR